MSKKIAMLFMLLGLLVGTAAAQDHHHHHGCHVEKPQSAREALELFADTAHKVEQILSREPLDGGQLALVQQLGDTLQMAASALIEHGASSESMELAATVEGLLRESRNKDAAATKLWFLKVKSAFSKAQQHRPAADS